MSSAASELALIGVDWGTSSLRAFLIGQDGAVLDQETAPEGIMQVKDGGFEAVLDRLISPRRALGLPILASGMITSCNGWVETPYTDLPLDADALAQTLVPLDLAHGGRIHFVAGAAARHAGGPDVMRGEETQIIGAVAMGLGDGVFVMPGTHSKWVQVQQGQIVDFATYMTGEVFAALKGHTILGTLMADGPFDDAAFLRGAHAGLAAPAQLLHSLFHVRTLPLTEDLSPEATPDFFSGLLIGTEIAAARQIMAAEGPVTVVGRNDLSDRYGIALHAAGGRSRAAPADVVACGHFQIARRAGVLQ